MLTVKDVMTPNPITITPDSSIDKAMDLIVEKKITALPVVNGEGELLGIVSEKDMLRLLYELKSAEPPVSEIMTPDPVTCNENDRLSDVCDALIRASFRSIPVLNGKKVTGILSRTDLIGFIRLVRKGVE